MRGIKGITVILFERTQTGTDALNNPVFSETQVAVENVLVGQPTTEDITDSISLYGKRLDYMLGLPKGDAHEWKDAEVQIFGRRFRAFGDVIEGIEENVPGPWHKKVRVERCE